MPRVLISEFVCLLRCSLLRYLGDGFSCSATTASVAISAPSTAAVIGSPVTITVRSLDINGEIFTGESGEFTFVTTDRFLYRPRRPTMHRVQLVRGVGTYDFYGDVAGEVELSLVDPRRQLGSVDISTAGTTVVRFRTSPEPRLPPATFGRGVVSAALTVYQVECDGLTQPVVRDLATTVAKYTSPAEVWAGTTSTVGSWFAGLLSRAKHCNIAAIRDTSRDWEPCVSMFKKYDGECS